MPFSNHTFRNIVFLLIIIFILFYIICELISFGCSYLLSVDQYSIISLIKVLFSNISDINSFVKSHSKISFPPYLPISLKTFALVVFVRFKVVWNFWRYRQNYYGAVVEQSHYALLASFFLDVTMSCRALGARYLRCNT